MMKNNQGFTLVEILVAMAITVVIAAAAISSFTGQQESQLSQKQIVEMQQNTRGGFYIMTQEIRMAGYDPYNKYNAGITNAGDGSNGDPLTFTLVADNDGNDNDNDGNVDEEGELKTISFQLYDGYGDGDNDIGRKVGAGNNQAIAENIQTLQFTYLDSNGNALVSPIAANAIPSIRAVRIDITAQVDRNAIDYTIQNATRSESSIVHFRNLNL